MAVNYPEDGQRIVCIRDDWSRAKLSPVTPALGSKWTIQRVHPCACPGTPHPPTLDLVGVAGFFSSTHFKPIDGDLDQLRSLLTGVPKTRIKEDA